MTTPGAVYKDSIILGFRAPETHPAPHGDLRAYDLKTGRMKWTFHTIPHPGEEGYETWPKDAWKTAGAANAWSGVTLDAKRGIVYAATGSAVDDFYGGDRVGKRSVREYTAGSGCGDGEAALALPGRASRYLGQGTSLLRRCWRRYSTRVRPWMRWRRRPNRGICICSTG